MNEPGDHVAVLQVEVVVGAEDVGWDDAGEHAAVLLVVGLVGDVNDALCMGIATVGVVGFAIVNLGGNEEIEIMHEDIEYRTAR